MDGITVKICLPLPVVTIMIGTRSLGIYAWKTSIAAMEAVTVLLVMGLAAPSIDIGMGSCDPTSSCSLSSHMHT
jgi:hypothetical protein